MDKKQLNKNRRGVCVGGVVVIYIKKEKKACPPEAMKSGSVIGLSVKEQVIYEEEGE